MAKKNPPIAGLVAPLEGATSAGVVTPDQAGSFTMKSPASEQPSLFPSEELIAPETITKFRKGVAALHSVPASPEHNHTLNSRRVMDACAALVQIDYRKRPKAQIELMREMEASPMFRVSKRELAKLAGITGKNYERIEQVLEKLHDMKINWNVLGEDASVEWRMTSRFISSYGIGTGRFEGMVCFAMDPRVLNIVLEPRFWAQLSLENVMHKLGTEPSYMLYQHAWRYIGTIHKVTADFPVTTWIELLLGNSRHVKTDPATGEKHVVDYNDFKRRTLLPSIERINKIAALNHTLELKEHRSGVKVLRLQFKFIPKKQQTMDLPLSWPDGILNALKNLGHDTQEIADLSQGYSLDEVGDALARYQEAAGRRRGHTPIHAPKAFFNGVLTNIGRKQALNEAELEKIDKQARAAEAEHLAQQRQARAMEDFNEHQYQRFKEGIAELPPGRLPEMLSEFQLSPAYKRAELLLTDGWDAAGRGPWTMLKAWILKERPEYLPELLPNPEDQSFAAWLVWRHEKPVE